MDKDEVSPLLGNELIEMHVIENAGHELAW